MLKLIKWEIHTVMHEKKAEISPAHSSLLCALLSRFVLIFRGLSCGLGMLALSAGCSSQWRRYKASGSALTSLFLTRLFPRSLCQSAERCTCRLSQNLSCSMHHTSCS